MSLGPFDTERSLKVGVAQVVTEQQSLTTVGSRDIQNKQIPSESRLVAAGVFEGSERGSRGRKYFIGSEVPVGWGTNVELDRSHGENYGRSKCRGIGFIHLYLH